MKFYLIVIVLMVSAYNYAVESSEFFDQSYCTQNLNDIGVSSQNAVKECSLAGFYANDMSYCAAVLVQRGIRLERAVRECQEQGSEAYQFSWCVAEKVNTGMREDLAVRRCR